tara:strand:+ start:114 stop:680 length:567 start_codon:yes stop_codon:yes gene_type:complete
MDGVQEALTSRRTVYRYRLEEVPDQILENAFEAASNAPCHKNTHPWKFYVMGEITRESLIPEVEKLAKKKSRREEEVGSGISKAIEKIISPPLLICVTSSRSPNDPFREEEDYAATACAIQNMTLSLWGNGVGSQWSTGAITRSDAAYTAIGASREEEKIVGFIKAGYPEKIPSITKKSVEEIRAYLP